MWDSIANKACDVCEFTRKENACDAKHEFFDKEHLSPVKNEDLSLYDGMSLLPETCRSDSSPGCPNRRSLDDIDASSQDSGYGTGFHVDHGKFLSYASPSRALSSSFGSASIFSMEDDFLEDFSDVEPLEKNSGLPKDFCKLINDPLVIRSKPKQKSSPKDTIIRPLFRRALSLQNHTTTPVSKVRTSLFSGNEKNKENRPSFKRAEPPTVLEKDHTMIKRSKLFGEFSSPQPPKKTTPLFTRQFSATEESIMCAVQRSSTEPDLIGDFTKSYCLPLTPGRHQDLKSITPETLARVMNGEFTDSVESYKVIDCRYPYEFVGGHINGAVNIFTKEQISNLLNESRIPSTSSNKRHILVFHCEFSSERGPNLYRHLRKEDRTRNMSDYPFLHYPEIYLLEGGYKKFFQEYADMCVPVAYKEMMHPDHEEDLRHFRQKSKTWNSDSRQRPTKSLKRL
ncbi:M-phase inducer phosphatase-like [Anthonomus grandis grandis]|uniref:M-phase inducer phosphatase-like n=1 Tax=Anthonomus grandis grandis TaxID=2921223 RepID=UPI0021662083|nr:M-phase inducer phosphatase-like [Anthonomus grandis grandis]